MQKTGNKKRKKFGCQHRIENEAQAIIINTREKKKKSASLIQKSRIEYEVSN